MTLFISISVDSCNPFVYSICAAISSNSPGPGAIPLVHARRVGGRGNHLFHLHIAAAMGGRACSVDVYRWALCSTWILWVFFISSFFNPIFQQKNGLISILYYHIDLISHCNICLVFRNHLTYVPCHRLLVWIWHYTYIK